MRHTLVRLARTDDSSAVIRMTEHFCAHQHEHFWPPAKEAVVFLAEDNKQVVGMVALHTYMAGDPQISHMWVDPGHRRKGIGRSLLDAVKSYVGSSREIMLSVRRENVEARHFFQSCDFRRGKFINLHLVTP